MQSRVGGFLDDDAFRGFHHADGACFLVAVIIGKQRGAVFLIVVEIIIGSAFDGVQIVPADTVFLGGLFQLRRIFTGGHQNPRLFLYIGVGSVAEKYTGVIDRLEINIALDLNIGKLFFAAFLSGGGCHTEYSGVILCTVHFVVTCRLNGVHKLLIDLRYGNRSIPYHVPAGITVNGGVGNGFSRLRCALPLLPDAFQLIGDNFGFPFHVFRCCARNAKRTDNKGNIIRHDGSGLNLHNRSRDIDNDGLQTFCIKIFPLLPGVKITVLFHGVGKLNIVVVFLALFIELGDFRSLLRHGYILRRGIGRFFSHYSASLFCFIRCLGEGEYFITLSISSEISRLFSSAIGSPILSRVSTALLTLFSSISAVSLAVK